MRIVSLAAEAFEGKKIVRHGDAEKDTVRDRETYGAGSWIAVPLLQDDAAVAALHRHVPDATSLRG